MQHEFKLPVAVHVSRREASRHMDRTRSGMVDIRGFFEGFADRINERFSRGRRLDTSDVDTLCDDAVTSLEAISPLVLRDFRRLPTRTRPKGEAREVLAVTSVGGSVDGYENWHLSAVRLYLDRKRTSFDQEHLGMSYTRHLLERAIERELVGRENGHVMIEEALYRQQGFIAAWRRAVALGLVPVDHDLHLPFGDGLLMGTTFCTQDNKPSTRYVNNRNMGGTVDVVDSGFRVLDIGRGEPAFIDWVGRTALPESMMDLDQMDYRNTARAFQVRHAELFRRIGEEGAWTHTDMSRALVPSDVAAELDAAAYALARIVRAPAFGRVYQDRRHLDTNQVFKRRMAA